MKRILISLLLLPLFANSQEPVKIISDENQEYQFYESKTGTDTFLLVWNVAWYKGAKLRQKTLYLVDSIAYSKNTRVEHTDGPAYHAVVSMTKNPGKDTFIRTDENVQKISSVSEFFKPKTIKHMMFAHYDAQKNKIVSWVKDSNGRKWNSDLGLFLFGILVIVATLLFRRTLDEGDWTFTAATFGCGGLFLGSFCSLDTVLFPKHVCWVVSLTTVAIALLLVVRQNKSWPKKFARGFSRKNKTTTSVHAYDEDW